MQSLRISQAAGAMALAVAMSLASAASAQMVTGFKGQARLATPVAAPTQTVVNGVTWSCEGDACTGVAERYTSLDGAVRECKQVAAALGPLTAYAARGRVVSGGSLRVCNSEVSAKAGGSTSLTARQ